MGFMSTKQPGLSSRLKVLSKQVRLVVAPTCGGIAGRCRAVRTPPPRAAAVTGPLGPAAAMPAHTAISVAARIALRISRRSFEECRQPRHRPARSGEPRGARRESEVNRALRSSRARLRIRFRGRLAGTRSIVSPLSRAGAPGRGEGRMLWLEVLNCACDGGATAVPWGGWGDGGAWSPRAAERWERDLAILRAMAAQRVL